MLTADRLLAFTLTAAVVIVVPGPSVLFLVGRALSAGRRVGLASVLGNSLGLLVMVFVVAAGLGEAVSRSTELLTGVQLLGAGLLIWWGIRSIRQRSRVVGSQAGAPEQPSVGAGGSVRNVVGEGFVVGVTNPKGVILLVAILPPFVDADAGSTSLQLLVLGAVAVALGVISDVVWVLAAAGVRAWFAGSLRRAEALSIVGGAMMIVLGVIVVVEALRP